MNKGKLLLAITAAATLFSLAIDFSLTRKYGGVDLRDKIVGARSLVAGRSLYFNPWQPGEPERYADPMVPAGALMTRYTGTPFQALVMAPLGLLSFHSLRLPWLLMQYGLLIMAVLFGYRAFSDGSDRARIMAGALFMTVLASGFWRLHVERGQVYILFAALIAALFWSLRTNRHMVAGAIAAALVLFKPTYAFLLLPLMLRINGRMLVGGGGLAAITVVVFMLIPNGLDAWVEYLEAMRAWSGMPGLGAPPSVDPNAFEYPADIEGMANLRAHHDMEFENGSVAAVLLAVAGLALPGWLPFAAYALLLAGAAALMGKRLPGMERDRLLLLGFCAWTSLMLLLPTPRFDYQMVHWIAPVLLLLMVPREHPFVVGALLLLAGALAIGGWGILPVNAILAEAALLIAAAWLLLRDRDAASQAR